MAEICINELNNISAEEMQYHEYGESKKTYSVYRNEYYNIFRHVKYVNFKLPTIKVKPIKNSQKTIKLDASVNNIDVYKSIIRYNLMNKDFSKIESIRKRQWWPTIMVKPEFLSNIRIRWPRNLGTADIVEYKIVKDNISFPTINKVTLDFMTELFTDPIFKKFKNENLGNIKKNQTWSTLLEKTKTIINLPLFFSRDTVDAFSLYKCDPDCNLYLEITLLTHIKNILMMEEKIDDKWIPVDPSNKLKYINIIPLNNKNRDPNIDLMDPNKNSKRETTSQSRNTNMNRNMNTSMNKKNRQLIQRPIFRAQYSLLSDKEINSCQDPDDNPNTPEVRFINNFITVESPPIKPGDNFKFDIDLGGKSCFGFFIVARPINDSISVYTNKFNKNPIKFISLKYENGYKLKKAPFDFFSIDQIEELAHCPPDKNAKGLGLYSFGSNLLNHDAEVGVTLENHKAVFKVYLRGYSNNNYIDDDDDSNNDSDDDLYSDLYSDNSLDDIDSIKNNNEKYIISVVFITKVKLTIEPNVGTDVFNKTFNFRLT